MTDMFTRAADSGGMLPRGELARLVMHVSGEHTARTPAGGPVAASGGALRPPTGGSRHTGLPVPPDVAMCVAAEPIYEPLASEPALDATSSLASPGPNRLPVAAGITLDPEVFGQAVAAAVAALLDARPDLLAPRPGTAQWFQASPVDASRRRSFWAGLWHADVVLAVLAMLIVLVILLAWAT